MSAAIERRAFLAALGLGLAAAPGRALAQQAKRPVRIGWISGGTAATFASRFAAFRAGLRELGLTDDAVVIAT